MEKLKLEDLKALRAMLPNAAGNEGRIEAFVANNKPFDGLCLFVMVAAGMMLDVAIVEMVEGKR